jgi:NAD(P)-dependent dehydrogenase (short-subunit alcohol dehydrogenase family)
MAKHAGEVEEKMSASANKKRVAIVTGASSGIGLGITQAPHEHAYRVVANSRMISKSSGLKPSADFFLVDGDIGEKPPAIRVVETAVKHFGHIDLLVNNAGIYTSRPLTEYTPEDFESMISTNFRPGSRPCPAGLWSAKLVHRCAGHRRNHFRNPNATQINLKTGLTLTKERNS